MSRSRAAIAFDAGQRWLMLRGLSRVLQLYPVLEYPKSGGSWFAQMLADALELPFPRNRRPPLASCVMHGHHLFHRSFRNVTCVLRDGRDVMVSAYYHFLFDNDRNQPHFVARHRDALRFDDYRDIRGNLPSFIDYLFDVDADRPRHFSWAEFVESWVAHDVNLVRYEELLEYAAATLGRSVRAMTGRELRAERLADIAAAYKFENLSRRAPGDENIRSFLRKGVAGDWVNHFSADARSRFCLHAGDALIAAGYEADRSWAD